MSTREDRQSTYYTRRRFLGAVGASAAGAATLAPGSLAAWPTLPAAFSGPGEFRMVDFLTFARVDPASRDQ